MIDGITDKVKAARKELKAFSKDQYIATCGVKWDKRSFRTQPAGTKAPNWRGGEGIFDLDVSPPVPKGWDRRGVPVGKPYEEGQGMPEFIREDSWDRMWNKYHQWQKKQLEEQKETTKEVKRGAGLLEFLGIKGMAPYMRAKGGHIYGGVSGINLPATVANIAQGGGMLGQYEGMRKIAGTAAVGMEKAGMISLGEGAGGAGAATIATLSMGELAVIAAAAVAILATIYLIYKVVKAIFTSFMQSKPVQYMESNAAAGIESAAALFLYGVIQFLNMALEFKNVIAGFRVFIDALGSGFTMSVDGLKLIWKSITDVVASYVAITVNFAKGMVSGIARIIKGILGVWEFWKTGTSEIFQNLFGGIGELWETILTTIGDFISAIFKFYGDFAEGIILFWGGVMQTILGGILGFLTAIGLLPEEWADWLLKAHETIVRTIAGATSIIFDFLASATKFIFDGLGWIIKNMYEQLGIAIDKILNVFMRIGNFLYNQIMSAFNQILEFLGLGRVDNPKGVGGVVTGGIESIGKGLGKIGNSAYKKAEEFIPFL